MSFVQKQCLLLVIPTFIHNNPMMPHGIIKIIFFSIYCTNLGRNFIFKICASSWCVILHSNTTYKTDSYTVISWRNDLISAILLLNLYLFLINMAAPRYILFYGDRFVKTVFNKFIVRWQTYVPVKYWNILSLASLNDNGLGDNQCVKDLPRSGACILDYIDALK